MAKILNKYFHMELGKAMALPGMCVALSSALFYDKKIVVLSILGTYLNGIILDHFIFGMNLKKRVCIVSEKQEEIRNLLSTRFGVALPFTIVQGPMTTSPGRKLSPL